jgi:hypothetical protein
MDTVECQHCHKHCVPRLWHYRPVFGEIRYRKTQHICPFCGATMYETGGEVPRFFWVILAAVATFLVYAFWPALQSLQFRSFDLFAFIMSAAIWGGIGYGIYRLCRRKQR